MVVVLWGCGVELLQFVQVCFVKFECMVHNYLNHPGQPLFLSLQGISYSTDLSNILVTMIGTTQDSALICHTDSPTCCRDKDNSQLQGGSGEWLFPNGTKITENSVTGDGFYWIRNYQSVRLYIQGDIIQNEIPLGTYCCRIPVSGGERRTFCANLVGEFTMVCIIICSDFDIPFQQHNVPH